MRFVASDRLSKVNKAFVIQKKIFCLLFSPQKKLDLVFFDYKKKFQLYTQNCVSVFGATIPVQFEFILVEYSFLFDVIPNICIFPENQKDFC